METLNAQLRLEEAIKITKSLRDLGITKHTCEDLQKFSMILNEWVSDGKFKSGTIEIPEINRSIVYQLRNPNKDTVVKLVR
jgi:hypothetical protein